MSENPPPGTSETPAASGNPQAATSADPLTGRPGAGGSPVPPAPPPDDRHVFNGRYELIRHVARGGMAEVYLARDLMLDRPVALKVLFPELSTDRTFVERFRREAQASANLAHPNIVGVYDYGEDQGYSFIVMEYVDGQTLSHVVRSEGPLTPARAAEVGSDVASALAFAHRNGVVHRDVKPGNVLITAEGAVKVTDFGIARAQNTDEALTQTGAVMGTATYFSPEQAKGEAVDPRSDVYSLGVVLYELVAGRPPFQADNPMAVALKHVREEPAPLGEVVPGVPADYERIVAQALAKDPEQRYQSAEALRDDLQRFRQGRPVLAAVPAGTAVLAEPTAAVAAVPTTRAQTAVGAGTEVITAERAPGVVPDPVAVERRSNTWLYALMLLVLLAVLGALLFLLARSVGFGGKGSTAQVTVPNVVGQSIDAAQPALENLGLKVNRVDAPDEAAPVGQVTAQDPAGDARVAKGSEVKLTVSAGADTVAVPNVANRTSAQAEQLLRDAGFTVQIEETPSDQVAAGRAITTRPGPGEKAPKNSQVVLEVSSGSDAAVIPNVAGKTVDDAFNTLADAGFKPVRASEASSSVEQGVVIRTDPAAGNSAAKGSRVTFYVSSGPATVDVPDVVGKTEAQARQILGDAGLRVVVQTVAVVDSADNGRVQRQSPAAGSTASQGDSVTIFVGRAPATTTTSSTTSTTTSSSSTTGRSTTTTTSALP